MNMDFKKSMLVTAFLFINGFILCYGETTTTAVLMDGMDHDNVTMDGMDHSNMSMDGHNMTMDGHNMTGGSHNMTDDATMHHGNHKPDPDGSDETKDHSSHGRGSNIPSSHHAGGSPFFFVSLESVILFEQWITSSWETMLGSCIGLAVISALYEGFKVAREKMLSQALKTKAKDKGCCNLMFSCMHILQSFLQVIQVTVSYCLMLVFMTFNVYLCAAVALGSGLGYFLFSWSKMRFMDQYEHCS